MDKKLSANVAQVAMEIGIGEIKNPIFYNSPVGMRFEVSEPFGAVFLEEDTENRVVNPVYIDAALSRAKHIYDVLPCDFDILQLSLYADETDVETFLITFCAITGLQCPDERLSIDLFEEDGEMIRQIQLFWWLKGKIFHKEALLREIILADFGGLPELVSSVYFIDTKAKALFHLYDDRGADFVVADKKMLHPLYEECKNWILEYDRERIDNLFIK